MSRSSRPFPGGLSKQPHQPAEGARPGLRTGLLGWSSLGKTGALARRLSGRADEHGGPQSSHERCMANTGVPGRKNTSKRPLLSSWGATESEPPHQAHGAVAPAHSGLWVIKGERQGAASPPVSLQHVFCFLSSLLSIYYLW